MPHRKLKWNGSLYQRGSAMLEFVVVGPLITILGLGIVQYGLMFFAKNQIDHASFMAARAGSVAHANVATIRDAYVRALVPLYGGGRNAQELAESYLKAEADMTTQSLRVEVLNPTTQSFDDFATNQALNSSYGMRAIDNSSLALRTNLNAVGATSGQTLQDANLLKLRITHGYTPKVWMLGNIFNRYQSWLDTGEDSFNTQLISSGRVPMVSYVTLEMQSDAIEQKDVNGANLFASTPGPGNNGQPTDPGTPPGTTRPPPECLTAGCTVTYLPGDPGTGGGSTSSGGGTNPTPCTGANCPTCNG
jgi:Flp pilus assembly protein TadG